MAEIEKHPQAIDVRHRKRGIFYVLGAHAAMVILVVPGIAATALLLWFALSGSISWPLDRGGIAVLTVLVTTGPGMLGLGIVGARNWWRKRPGARVMEIAETGLTFFETATGRSLDPPMRLKWSEIQRVRLDEGPYRSSSLTVFGRCGRKWSIPTAHTEPDLDRIIESMLAAARRRGVGIDRTRRYLLVVIRTTWRFRMPAA